MIEEHHLQVPRTARYFTLGESGPGITEVWFALHGYAQIASSFVRHCQPLEAPGRLVVVPEALSRFYIGDHTRPATPDTKVGASWMTREDRLSEINDYIQFLDRLHGAVLERLPRENLSVHVLGFSQGSATATRWLTRGEAKAQRLILWGAPMPSDLDLALDGARLRQMEIILVSGTDDEYMTSKVIAAEEGRLGQVGARFRTIRFKGGHTLDREVLEQLGGTK